ncbi:MULTISPECIES: DUF6538 domain-containing protein [unclassified Salipiger]|uniref:DUF6538 domain-containing protein n=1 Tax=unclassified Salipiger TaxID=2640570 RepID=UPI0013BA2E70|nr:MULTISPECIES: DUF6538 domain-containing protein [unclassified Salipiger]NDV51992.1 tyrosine-type recombinase/integrase [Salipiger sp. PrR003]NDW33542.1 tyrosine-type recombinase/integrase [Salipiger sp. PrR007]
MLEYKSAPFTFRKDGIFYFARRVPYDLLHHYSSDKISYSLRTRSSSVAAARATQAACKLDEYWFHLRSQEAELPGRHLLRTGLARPKKRAETDAVTSDALTLSEAVVTYLRQKGQGKSKTFHRAAERSCGYVIDACGDKPLADYSKKDANSFRDALIKKGLTGSSITRVFGTVRSVFNFAASEEGLSIINPFTNVYYDREAGVTGRLPIPLDDIRKVQQKCQELDDELRWLVAIVSDTGMRLAEAAGLLRDDIQESEDGILFVRIAPHPWRRLKTKGSERSVPLVGVAEWAARRLMATRASGEFAFPRYNKCGSTNANSASAALNKWIKLLVHESVSMHSFRHSMRDRLRLVECPSDIADQIGGWQPDSIGQSYGRGYPLSVLEKWMKLTA